MIRTLKIVGVALVAIYLTWFAFENGDLVTMKVPLVGEFVGTPGRAVAAVGALVGGLVSALCLTWPLLRMRSQVRRDAKRIARLEEELHGLRTLPLEARDGAALSSSRLEDVEKAQAPGA